MFLKKHQSDLKYVHNSLKIFVDYVLIFSLLYETMAVSFTKRLSRILVEKGKTTGMKLTRKILIVSLSLILLIIPGCDFAREQIANLKMPRGIDLRFETVIFEYNNLLHSFEAQVVVIADNKTELTGINNWITDEVSSKIHSVDFSRYFVLMSLMGDMGSTGYGIRVNKIWQNEKTIYIKADFISSKPGALEQWMNTSPKQIVMVSKEKMPNFGEITFKLMDKFGKEWATSSAEIPPYLK